MWPAAGAGRAARREPFREDEKEGQEGQEESGEKSEERAWGPRRFGRKFVSSETSSSSSQKRGCESDSELSFEPPLRKKALTAPGSVLTDLIKHAQEQMDKGALMDHEGQPASLTSGVKLSTYFALLIRPYFPNNNPLLRELYCISWPRRSTC